MTTALLVAALLLQSPPPRDCRVPLKTAIKWRQRSFADCMAAIGVSAECHRRADGAFEEKLAELRAFEDCDAEIEEAEKRFEAEARDNGFPLGQAIGRGLRRLFGKAKR